MGEGNYRTLKDVINKVEGVTLKDKHGGTFRFPLYLTEAMENTGIESLELGVRSYNCLKRAGYNTIGQLAYAVAGGSELKKIRNCGAKSVREIMERLFLYQYHILKPERQEKFLRHVVEMNR
jgi:DNA-directed RNA polymerase alpha subunit